MGKMMDPQIPAISKEGSVVLFTKDMIDATHRVEQILRSYTSEGTKKAHARAVQYWKAWAEENGLSIDALTPEQIAIFIVQHAEGMPKDIEDRLIQRGAKKRPGTHSLNTIRLRVIGLLDYFEKRGVGNPAKHPQIWHLLRKIKKIQSKPLKKARAITKGMLLELLETADRTKIGTRNKAILLFGWSSGGRRRSEITSADMTNLQTDGDGFLYTIPKSKTDQEARGHSVPIRGMAATALKEWLNISGIAEGKIFRAVSKSGTIGGPLSDIDVSRIIKKACKKAGYDPSLYSAHSLRSGFITQCGKQGIALAEAMALSGHKSHAVVLTYHQSGSISTNAAANLL